MLKAELDTSKMITLQSIINGGKKTQIFAQKLKEVDIFSLIPEQRFKEAKAEDILIQGELFKYTPPQIHFAHAYVAKYCVLTKTEFRYYKSKETFFRLGNPLMKLPIFSITYCDIFDPKNLNLSQHDKKKEMYTFSINLKKEGFVAFDTDKSTLRSTMKQERHNKQNSIDLNGSKNPDDLLEQFMSNKHVKEENRKAKKIILINSVNQSKEQIIVKPKFIEEDSSLLVFATSSDDHALKWIKSLNFLVNK